MPSARVHEAIAKKINNDYKYNEKLLRIGTISPDCWRNVPETSGIKDKYLSHFWDFRIKDGQANDYANLDEMLKMIMHEFVHACNDEVKKWVRKTIWFHEGLATNLAHQDYEITDLETCDFEKLEWNFNGYGSGSYSYAYTIVNYLLSNYSHEEVMYFVKEPDYLIENSKTIFNQAKEWAKKMGPQR